MCRCSEFCLQPSGLGLSFISISQMGKQRRRERELAVRHQARGWWVTTVGHLQVGSVRIGVEAVWLRDLELIVTI